MLRIVYFGTPAFAVPALVALAGDPRFEVKLVVSQPDRPAGRGRRLESPPVAAEAVRLGLPLYQPATLRMAEDRLPLADAEADVFVVAAFGLIFGKRTLGLPPLGCLNLHGSLLPRFRGASPVQAAILEGDERTGITLMRMDQGLDTGDLLATREEPIEPTDTTEALMARLALVAAELAVEAIPRYAGGDIVPAPQPAEGATVTRQIAKADGWIDWTQPAAAIDRRVRALWPWPRAWTTIGDAVLQIHAASPASSLAHLRPGDASVVDDRLLVGCGDGTLALDVVQPAGRRPVPGGAFFRGLGKRAVVFGGAGSPEPMPPLVVAA